jgi:capsular polysaccharide transport system permease protein
MMATPLRERTASPDTDRPASQKLAPAVAVPSGPARLPVLAPESGPLTVSAGRNGGRQAALTSRRRQVPYRLLSFVLVVAVPAILIGIYFFYVAADQYVAEFRFALRGAEPGPAEISGFLQGSVGPSLIGVDSYAVVQYLGSRDIIEDLENTLDLPAMFSRPEADWPARLQPPVRIEEFVRYWKHQVDAFYDATNGTIVVRARAFRPDDALNLAQGIFASAERLVNHLSARARHDTLKNAESEVRRAERRLKTALARLSEFRDREGLIDPQKTADTTQALEGRIRDEIVRADTELSTVKHYMRADAPSVKVLEARIQSLQTQLHSVQSEVTDTERSRSEVLSRVMGAYEQLESERTFAEKAYQHALEALDRARIDADRQQIYIAGFVQPSLPEKPLYPKRLSSFGLALFLCCAVWVVGGFVVRTVREHL